MKLVEENIQFKRGQEPKDAMNLGTPVWRKSIRNWVYFCYNYPSNFMDAWEENHIKNHIQSKFEQYYKSEGPKGVMNKFFLELDRENQNILMDWVMNNYKAWDE